MRFMRIINLKKFLKEEKGQVLMEVLIAIVIGGIFVTGATISLITMIRQNFENRGNQIASTVAYNMVNNAKNMAQSNWHSIYDLSKGSSNKYFLVKYATSSTAVSGIESILFNDITASLIGIWKFDEDSGATAYDSSGNLNNGTLISSPTRVASSSCKAGKCLNFDGSTNYVDLGNPSELQITGNQTITMWLKPDDLSIERNPFAKSYGAEGTIKQGTDGIMTYYYGTAGGNSTPFQSFSSSGNVSIGNWYFVALVRDLTNTRLHWYINGSLDNSADASYGTASTSTLSAYIGDGDSGNYAGSIDDFRIYNRALSADEINALYESSVYERYFYVENVERDSSGLGDIVASGGTEDPSTQKIYSNVSWLGNRSLSFSTYQTRYNDYVINQGSWDGGPGETGPLTNATTTFYTSNNITYESGTLTLATTTSSGDLESVTFDMGTEGGAVINSVLWSGTLPASTEVKFQLAYSNNSGGPWSYVGSDGTGATYFTPTGPDTSEITNIHNYRYFRYKIFLAPSGGSSPTIENAIINWSN